jgi:hypothetical protein
VERRERYDENAWHPEQQLVTAHCDKVRLALLENLSNLLVTHGYPPLRGATLEQITWTLVHLRRGR